MKPFCLPLACCALFGAATLANAGQCEPDKVTQKYPQYAGKVIKIAASPAQPPFAYSDPDNPDQMLGFEAELIQNAMDCAGLKYQYYKGAWTGLLPTLFAGSTDLMIGSVNYRPERAAKADFVLYARAGQSVIVPKGNPKKLTKLDDLCGLVGSANMSGSSAQSLQRQSQKCTEKGLAAIDYRPADSAESAYRQILTGRMDFVLDDSVAASARIAKEPSMEVVYTEVMDIYTGMVVAKGNTEMLQVISDGLSVQQSDGRFDSLAEKYKLPKAILIPIEVKK
ncbi:transporter substrate-binding domain-containing protein [Brucella cytisi]|uniref:transporter substrate-binding domain-containing protein n=1 Tax=Brucella cytisi TaxID=407152 RepID=UPI0035D98820